MQRKNSKAFQQEENTTSDETILQTQGPQDPGFGENKTNTDPTVNRRT